jgi:uncharacterized RDD family membrane protein YckC
LDGHRTYAGLVSRFGGLVVDTMLAALAVGIIGRGIPEAWKLVAGALPAWLSATFRYVAAVAPAVYFAACWRMTGETLGAWIFGTQVTHRDGRSLRVVRAVLRSVLGLLFAPLWLVGMVTILFDTRRRSLLDMAFGTVVRYVPRPGAEPAPSGPSLGP